jgi:hypothetical protein
MRRTNPERTPIDFDPDDTATPEPPRGCSVVERCYLFAHDPERAACEQRCRLRDRRV